MTEGNAKSNRIVPSTLIWFAGGTLCWLILAGAAALVGAITLLDNGVEVNPGLHGAVLSVVWGRWEAASPPSSPPRSASRTDGSLRAGRSTQRMGRRTRSSLAWRPSSSFARSWDPLGFLAYAGIVGGFLIDVEDANAAQFSDEGLLFITA